MDRVIFRGSVGDSSHRPDPGSCCC